MWWWRFGHSQVEGKKILEDDDGRALIATAQQPNVNVTRKVVCFVPAVIVVALWGIYGYERT